MNFIKVTFFLFSASIHKHLSTEEVYHFFSPEDYVLHVVVNKQSFPQFTLQETKRGGRLRDQSIVCRGNRELVHEYSAQSSYQVSFFVVENSQKVFA